MRVDCEVGIALSLSGIRKTVGALLNQGRLVFSAEDSLDRGHGHLTAIKPERGRQRRRVQRKSSSQSWISGRWATMLAKAGAPAAVRRSASRFLARESK